MGRDRFFDDLINKSVEWSKTSNAKAEGVEGGEASSDAIWEELINDEEWFASVFPDAVREKIRRKVIAMIVHTVIFGSVFLFL
jgi:hypothetical protein